MTALDLLLVDGRHALWRAADKFDGLVIETNEGQEETGAIYGFLTILCKVQMTFGGTVVVCWDDWVNGPAARVAMCPSYKHSKARVSSAQAYDPEKVQMRASMAQQQTRLMWILGLFGIPQAFSEGWEADDVMGTLAARLRSTSTTGIYSGDRDMYQCVNGTVSVIRPVKGGEYAVVTPDEVVHEYGVEPSRFVEMKALAGDTGDNIPGIAGIGPKTASTILRHFRTAEEACSWAGSWLHLPAASRQKARLAGITDNIESKLALGLDAVKISKKLATINTDVKLIWAPLHPDKHEATQEMVRMKFLTILRGGRLERLMGMGMGLSL